MAAILGTTKKSIKDLTDEARRLGATTSYTAAQVTELQIELAKLGFFKEDIKAMTPSVLKFAKAVDTDPCLGCYACRCNIAYFQS